MIMTTFMQLLLLVLLLGLSVVDSFQQPVIFRTYSRRIILKAIGIPTEMFTVIFAIGRMPGWISHWKEIAETPKQKIHRPRQIYVGSTERQYVGINQRA